MPAIALPEIERVTKAALERHGAQPWIAAEVARAVRAAESVGNKICGLYYLESYCVQLQTGRVRGDVAPVVSRPRASAVTVDARFGFAQPAFARGLPQALEAARETGLASLAVGHAHTCTSLGYFTEQIARAGMIGFGLTNATPIVAPPGGKARITTTVALGKITMAKAAGETIPPGWALDKDGNPTTEPEAALAGSLVSMGGYKGWGLGLMAELLAAGMTGGLASQDVAPLKAPNGPPHDLGQYYLLIDPSVSDSFFDRLNQVAVAVADDEGTRMPGRGKAPMDPVDLAPAVWYQALALAGMG